MCALLIRSVKSKTRINGEKGGLDEGPKNQRGDDGGHYRVIF